MFKLSRPECGSGCVRTEEWKKTGKGQVEVEREEGEVKERRSCVKMGRSETQEHLEP